MKKIIVTTTINPPTEAVRGFDALPDWELIVVGDRRTPSDYRIERGRYVSPAEQENYDPILSDLIGWDCTARRNFGFLLARECGAEVVATVDDDNVPLSTWGENLLVDQEVTVHSYHPRDSAVLAFDPMSVTNWCELWHRGFPLELLQHRRYEVRRETITPVVQADLWHGDPDVDAVCRAVYAPRDLTLLSPSPFTSPLPAPFNSQNTFVSSSVLRDYFMFPFTGRMEDIWAAYHLQSLGHRVVFNAASVRQVRNPHNLTTDLQQELHGYGSALENVTRISERAGVSPVLKLLSSSCLKAFTRYQEHFK